ncbi:YlbG family protein [Fructilactobacillus vespulae]|uniref:YlbG family protein n=1 Tax=Fructilactobacillus vespulae TaxID=1249630 RepID=UPI0039B58297
MESVANRTELLVSTFSSKQVKLLKKYGDIRFISKKMHYVILFVNSDDADEIMAEIKKHRFVKRVEKTVTLNLIDNLNELNNLTMGEE